MTPEEAEAFRAALENLLREHRVYLTAGQHGDGIVLQKAREDHEIYAGFQPRMSDVLDIETRPGRTIEPDTYIYKEPGETYQEYFARKCRIHFGRTLEKIELPSQEPGRISPDTPW